MESNPIQEREATIFNSRLILFFVAVTLFVALLHRQHDLSIMSLLVLLTMGGAKLWSVLSLGRVTCTTETAHKRVFAGETLVMSTTVTNKKYLPVWVRLEWPAGRLAAVEDGKAQATAREAGILWQQQVRFDQDLTALRRGVFTAGPSRIQTSDFFGFFRTEKKLPKTNTIIVYPKLVDVRNLDLSKRDLFGKPGSRHPVKDPVYVTGIRDYQASSPARHIHWKASARHARLHEKVFEPSQKGKVMVVLDVNGFSDKGLGDEFERTLEVIASLCLQIESRDMVLGFATNGAASDGNHPLTSTGQGTGQLTTVLEVLAKVQMYPEKSLTEVMRKTVIPVRGITCLCFACGISPELEHMRRLCLHRQIPLAVFVHQPDDETQAADSASRTGVVPIQDLLSGGEMQA